ncbi:MAG: hypothetical protein ACLR20_08100 [Bifidobacterium longum]
MRPTSLAGNLKELIGAWIRMNSLMKADGRVWTGRRSARRIRGAARKRPIIISQHSSYSYGHADGKKHHQIDIDIELYPLAMFGPIGVLAVAVIVYAVTGSWLVTASAALTASKRLVLPGIALRWRKRVVNQRTNEQMESALADLRHGNQLAIELHDTLSNDMTYISTIARNNLAAPAGIDGGDWQRADRSQRAFAEVHGIIDFLTEQSEWTPASGTSPCWSVAPGHLRWRLQNQAG